MANLRSDVHGALLEAALTYAAAGWPVFPCRPATKQPLTLNGYKDATVDADQIRAWWRQWPDAMIGVPMGPATGVFALDIDVRADGRDGFAHVAGLEAAHGDLPACPRVITPSGGMHLYFAFDHDRPATTSRGRLPVGMDVRGYGGYVIAPPSVRPDGKCYAWDASFQDQDTPFAPDWLLDLIVPRLDPLIGTRTFEPDPSSDRYAEAALEGEYVRVSSSPRGARNADLNRAAFSLGQFVAGGVLPESRVRETLFRAAEVCGLVQDDGARAAHKTISSGLKGGAAHPRVGPERMQRIEDIASALLAAAGLEEPEDDDLEASATGPDPIAGFTFYGEGLAPPPYLLKGLLPKDGVAFIGGQSGAGKTFIICHLAACLASQQPFFGRRVKERVGVVILAAEGAGTLPLRLKVAGEDIAGDEPLPIAFLPSVPNLMDPKEIRQLGERLKALSRAMQQSDGIRLGVIVIDTVAAAFEMQDEDNNAEAARAIRRMKALADAVGALVIGVHHYGKDSTTGLRGASAWRAGADTVLSVLADRNQITGDVQSREIALAKSRSAEEGPIAPFSLKFIKVGEDEDGDDFGACIVIPEAGSGSIVNNAANLKPKEARSVRAFKAAFSETMAKRSEFQPIMGDGPNVRVVAIRNVRERFQAFYVTGENDDKKAYESTQRAWRRIVQDIDKLGYKTGFWQGEEWIWDVAAEMGA